MNRRALGALVGTFVLIGFSMLLGFFFMSWGKSYIEQRAEFVVGVASGKAGCSDIGLAFIEINRIPQVCHGPQGLKFFVENVGDTPIIAMSARVVDAGITEKDNILSSPIGIGESKDVSISTNGQAKQVKLTPMISADGSKQFCFDKALAADGPFSACNY